MGGKEDASPRWSGVERGLLVLGALLVILGALVGKLWSPQITARFYEEMALTETCEGYAEWMSPTVDIRSSIYLWNWTNAEELGSADYVPHFDEVGPYVFREKHEKVNVTWNANGTVSYKTLKFWFFDPDLSSGSLDDKITSVNTVAATLSAMSLNWGYFQKKSIGVTLMTTQQKVYWTKTVAELTFEGFDNPIVKFGSYISPNTKPKFGYFYDMNGTIPADLYNVATGVLDIFRIGQIEFVNYKNTTPAHEGACSDMTGSIGEFWPPDTNNASQLVMFTPDMCRRITYYYDGETTYNGIKALVFASTPATVDNGSLVEENACYCHPGDCQPSGVFDLRSCREGAPVFMSLPHLLHADPYHRQGVEGLRPDPEKHKFYITLEPKTGVPLEVAARLQLNVRLHRNSGVRIFRNVPDVLVPVFWIETKASLTEWHTAGVQLFLTVLGVGPFACAAIIVVGAILVVILLVRRFTWKHCKHRERTNSVSLSPMDKTVVETLMPSDAVPEGDSLVKYKLSAP